MSAVRFATARDLFETFPSAGRAIAAAPTDEASPAFVRRLLQRGEGEAAVGFCAYLLGRRSAVRWLCACLRQIMPSAAEDAALAAGAAWVETPDDDHRRAALERGRRGDPNHAATWVALAAGWSGGSLGPAGGTYVPMPDHLTAEAVRTAMILATFRLDASTRARTLAGFAEAGVKLAHRAPDGGA